MCFTDEKTKVKQTETHPCSNLTLPKPALLSDFIRPTKLFHVFAKVTLGAVFCSSAGLTFPAHPDRTLDLGGIQQCTKSQSNIKCIAYLKKCLNIHWLPQSKSSLVSFCQLYCELMYSNEINLSIKKVFSLFNTKIKHLNTTYFWSTPPFAPVIRSTWGAVLSLSPIWIRLLFSVFLWSVPYFKWRIFI